MTGSIGLTIHPNRIGYVLTFSVAYLGFQVFGVHPASDAGEPLLIDHGVFAEWCERIWPPSIQTIRGKMALVSDDVLQLLFQWKPEHGPEFLT